MAVNGKSSGPLGANFARQFEDMKMALPDVRELYLLLGLAPSRLRYWTIQLALQKGSELFVVALPR